MSRRKAAPKREILPDPKFGSQILTKFINHVMKSGKKAVAERIVYGALSIIEEHNKKQATAKRSDDGEANNQSSIALNPIDIFSKAIDNVRPTVEVKSRRVGGATYQVPIEVRADRSITLAMRLIVEVSQERTEKSMSERLAGELLDASTKKGRAVKKCGDIHRMAEANKAFAHYRW